MTKRYWYPGWDKANPTDVRPPYHKAISLTPNNPHGNYATALGLPVNNAVIRARYYSPRSVQGVDPATVLASNRVTYHLVGRNRGPRFGASMTFAGANPGIGGRLGKAAGTAMSLGGAASLFY